uniref:G-protein coupled receptors family 1 profile domain-containing protein n=1 Tax=Amphiprion percula TaxID=161767 RepID=A0A3P8SX97_AMPPE
MMPPPFINMLTLSGLSGTANYRVTLFVLTLLCYFVIWLVNMTIIVTIIVDKSLHEPMYIFLCNLCINALYGTAGFYPKFLYDLLSATHVISYAGCLLQGYVLHSSACADFSLLALMAYDRYVAICRPLVYHTAMSKQRICIFVTITTSALRLCGSLIPRIYCVNWLISNLACSASIATVIVPAFNYTFYFGHVVFIFWSYLYLIKTCQSSKENTSKFMQTCMPHVFSLAVVGLSFHFDLLYMRFGKKEISQNVKNFMAMEFLLIPPIFNPIMYGLKLTQIRQRLSKFICSKSSL